MGIRFLGEEDYNRDVLVHAGVPDTAIHIFPNAIMDTEQEVDEVASEMREQNKSTVIIVTSPQHTRRVRALWQKIAGGNAKLIVRAAFEDHSTRIIGGATRAMHYRLCVKCWGSQMCGPGFPSDHMRERRSEPLQQDVGPHFSQLQHGLRRLRVRIDGRYSYCVLSIGGSATDLLPQKCGFTTTQS